MVIALLLKIECRLKICKSRTSGFINASGGEREAKKSFHMHDSGWRIWLHWTPGVAIIHGPCNKIKINFYNNWIKYWSCLCSDVFFSQSDTNSFALSKLYLHWAYLIGFDVRIHWGFGLKSFFALANLSVKSASWKTNSQSSFSGASSSLLAIALFRLHYSYVPLALLFFASLLSPARYGFCQSV